MPIEPPGKITEIQIIRREENDGSKRKKKEKPRKEETKRAPDKPGRVDIKI